MKRIFLTLLLVAGMTALSYGKVILRGESNTAYGRFTLEVCDEPQMLAGEMMKCYLVTYENSPDVVKIFVDKEKNCKNYVVVSGKTSVMYTCNGNFLGVKQVDSKYAVDGILTDLTKLNRSNYLHQKVLARGITEDFDATGLIASYFPALLD